MIGILDYGGGNLASVRNALERISIPSDSDLKNEEVFFVSDDPDNLQKAEKIIFPGQGRAGDVMDALKRKGLDDFLKTTEKPFLGICVGMQVLFDYLEEDDCPGLGIISGKVIRFDPQKVGIIPHMGWNQVNSQFSILNSQFSTDDFYFVHSYYCVPKNAAHCIATTDYSQQRFCSSVAKANFYGMQFHPEKSGLAGEKILQWFCIRK